MAHSATRQRLTHGARRAQLVAVGLELLRSRPLDELSLEDVAAAAGTSRALPFHYFASRTEFLVAVVQASSEELLAATAADEHLDPLERLQLGLDGYVDYIEANPATYVALVRGAAGAQDELVAVFDATREIIVHRILDGLGLEPATPLARLAVRGWLGMVEEATVSWLRSRSTTRPELVALLREVLVRTADVISAAGATPAPHTPPDAKEAP